MWLPFDPAELGGLPEGLAAAVYNGDELPAGAELVELYVLPYTFSAQTLEVMAGMPRLQVVQTLTAGYEHVLPYLPDGITLCNARGLHDTATAELTLTLTLAAQNEMPHFLTASQHREWSPRWRRGLADSTVLLVGYGSIGQAIARRLEPFECTVLPVARHARHGVAGWEQLPDLLPRADIVILIVPSTPETTGMVDAAFLGRMRDDALLVNVARGVVVDTDALVAELGSGRLRAALDVTAPEPLPADHPLWKVPGLVLSPHVGGVSRAFRPRALRMTREVLGRFAAGEAMVNVVVSGGSASGA